nr:P6 protein [Carrot reovirus 1]
MASYLNFMQDFLNAAEQIHQHNYNLLPPANINVQRIDFQSTREYSRDCPPDVQDMCPEDWTVLLGDDPMTIIIPFNYGSQDHRRNWAAVINFAHTLSRVWPQYLRGNALHWDDCIREDFDIIPYRNIYLAPPDLEPDRLDPPGIDDEQVFDDPPFVRNPIPEPRHDDAIPQVEMVMMGPEVHHRHQPPPVIREINDEFAEDDDMFGGLFNEEEFVGNDPPRIEDRQLVNQREVIRLRTIRSHIINHAFARQQAVLDPEPRARPRFGDLRVPEFARVTDFTYRDVPQDGWLNENGLALNMSGGMIANEVIPLHDIDEIIRFVPYEDEQLNKDYIPLRAIVFNTVPIPLRPIVYDITLNIGDMIKDILLTNVITDHALNRLDSVCSNYLLNTEPERLESLLTPMDRNAGIMVMCSNGLVCLNFNSCPKKLKQSIIPIGLGRRVCLRIRAWIASVQRGVYVDATTLLLNWMRIIYPETYSPIENVVKGCFFDWVRRPRTLRYQEIVPYLEGTEDDDGNVDDHHLYYPPVMTPLTMFQTISELPFFRLILDLCTPNPTNDITELRNRLSDSALSFLKVIFHTTTLAFAYYWDPCDPSYYFIGPYVPSSCKFSTNTNIVTKANAITEKAYIYLILMLLGFA